MKSKKYATDTSKLCYISKRTNKQQQKQQQKQKPVDFYKV